MKALWRLIAARQLLPALATQALYKPFYRLSFVTALKEAGFLERLADGPVAFAALATTHATGTGGKEALRAWLQMGCRLGLLRADARGYALAGLARTLARPENDATLALAQEVAGLHHRLIRETPAKLAAGDLWGLENQDGELTARSSRALEAFQLPALERYLPRRGACRLLEVGCGSGTYIQHATRLNPELTALGLELQADVAELARRNVVAWGLTDRVAIETGDIRTLAAADSFDVVTLYNNIYYFAVADRVALLARVRSLLAPDGALLLTTCCQGGNLGIEALNLWGASNAHGGRLPERNEMESQLHDAGFAGIETMRLIPGDSFYAFHARPRC